MKCSFCFQQLHWCYKTKRWNLDEIFYSLWKGFFSFFWGDIQELWDSLPLLRMWLNVTELDSSGSHSGCSVVWYCPTGTSCRMSEEIPDFMWCYLPKFIFGHLLWTGSSMKDTVVHVDRDIFNQMLRRQDKRVTLVFGVVRAHSRAQSVNCHLLVPDTSLAAALDTFQQFLLESSSQTTKPEQIIALRSSWSCQGWR